MRDDVKREEFNESLEEGLNVGTSSVKINYNKFGKEL
jgi:hypothetical protein